MSVRNCVVCAMERGGVALKLRSVDQVERERPFKGSGARRDLEVREIRISRIVGWIFWRWVSWVRKWRPTPPAPGGLLDCGR